MSPFSAERHALHSASAIGRRLPLLLVLVLGVMGCEEPGEEPAKGPGDDAPAADVAASDHAVEGTGSERPETITDSIRIEGMAEGTTLRLFRSPDDFPLPFTTYVPADMTARADPGERTADFTAAFGGTRNDDAFMHVYLFPEGTPLQEALATAKGYKTSRGVPVSRGLEPVADELPPPDLDWAIEAYRFLYESGEWYSGALGVGEHDGRYYMIVRHYPVEYGDGFAPRAALILERWRWDDGSPLQR